MDMLVLINQSIYYLMGEGREEKRRETERKRFNLFEKKERKETKGKERRKNEKEERKKKNTIKRNKS